MACASSKLLPQQVTFAGATLSYDPAGNLTSDGTITYTWDARHRLTAVNGPTPANFLYDGVGRRSAKAFAGVSTAVLHDGLTPVQEQSGGISVNLLPGLGIDEFLLQTAPDGMRIFLADALGSTVVLTDPTGAVQTSYTYEPFGAATLTGATATNLFDFMGRETDLTGLKYYRARYYDSRRARFLNEDPMGIAGGINLYSFAANRPTQYIDPLGLRPGDVYPTLNETGVAAACDAAGPTVETGHEWGGWIYKMPEGWTYSPAVTSGKERTVDIGDPDPQRPLAGWYHTHPQGVALPSPDDRAFSEFYGAPGFVWGRRPTFGGDGSRVVTRFGGRKDSRTQDLGGCPLAPDIPPGL